MVFDIRKEFIKDTFLKRTMIKIESDVHKIKIEIALFFNIYVFVLHLHRNENE